MARAEDRLQTRTTGQWTYYRGRWWRFTGTGWVESNGPPEGEQASATQALLRYHRDGEGTYWLQHPRTGQWHRHEGATWVPSPDAPADLDPEPLAPSPEAPPNPAPAVRRAPRSWRVIVAVSALVVVGLVAVLAVAGGSTKGGGSPSPTAPRARATVPGGGPTTSVPPGSAPSASSVRLKVSGSGNSSTAPFTVRGSWHLEYSFNCANEGIGATDNFIVNVNGHGAADHTRDSGVNVVGNASSGIEHYGDRGTFYLTVETGCRWKVQVVAP